MSDTKAKWADLCPTEKLIKAYDICDQELCESAVRIASKVSADKPPRQDDITMFNSWALCLGVLREHIDGGYPAPDQDVLDVLMFLASECDNPRWAEFAEEQQRQLQLEM